LPRKRSRGGKRRVDTTASFVSSFSSVLVEPPALVGESARCFTAPILLCDDDVSDDDEDICMCALFTTGLSLFSSFSAAFGLVVEKKRAVVNVFRKVFRLDTPPKTFNREREIHFFPGVRFTDSLSPKSYVVQIAPCPCLWTRTVVQSPSPFPQTKKKNKKKNWTVV
jgi:hypothetical protein